MDQSQLTVKLARGDVSVELSGDATAVTDALRSLRDDGLGTFAGFFGMGWQAGAGAPTTALPIGNVVGAGSPPSPGAPATVVSATGRSGAGAPLSPGSLHRYVVDRILIPRTGQFATDLNGDGKPDNAFGRLAAAIDDIGLALQAEEDAAVSENAIVHLLSIRTAGTNDPDPTAASVSLQPGKSLKPQVGVFAPDPNEESAVFSGRFSDAGFSATAPHPVTAVVYLGAFSRSAPVRMVLNGAHVQLTVSADGSRVTGEIHGSIRKTDVDTIVAPAIAKALSGMIAANPTGSSEQQLRNLFDTGGCTNPDGTKAVAGDGRIDVCELLTNQLFSTLLSPDVQIFAGDGSYAPSPSKASPDSLSIGLGFTGITTPS
jgi:hypothetical protein